MSASTRLLLLGLAGSAALGVQAGSPERGSSPLEAERGKVVTVFGVPDPHGDPARCAECHAVASDGAPAPGAPPMAACERCHPDTNFHLVGVVPEEEVVPDRMPLEEGRVACVSCHDEPACDGLPRDGRGEDHFRAGPYRQPLELCFRCHDRATYQRTDPHRDLRTADGQRNDAVCIFCHQGVPESEQDERIETLRVDPLELCKGCHAQQIHIGIPSHLRLLPEAMVPVLERWNATAAHPIPLGPRREVLCTSCHDPHPGMDPVPTATSPEKLDRMRVANHEYRDRLYLPRMARELSSVTDADGRVLVLADGERTKEGLLRVPAEDGTLCLVCHDLDAEGR